MLERQIKAESVSSNTSVVSPVRTAPIREIEDVGLLYFDQDLDSFGLYLGDLRSVAAENPLLTREKEQVLGKQMVRGRMAEDELLNDDRYLLPEEKEELKMQIKKGKAAEACIVEANLRLVVFIARKYINDINRVLTLPELVAIGNLAAVRAAGKYECGRGRFSKYVGWWIWGEIINALERETHRLPPYMARLLRKIREVFPQLTEEIGEEPTAEEVARKFNIPIRRAQAALGLLKNPFLIDSLDEPIDSKGKTLADVVEDEKADYTFAKADLSLLRKSFDKVMELVLTPTEEQVIRLRYGLKPSGVEYTQREVGQKFGVRRQRIQQIEKVALEKLKKAFLEMGLEL